MGWDWVAAGRGRWAEAVGGGCCCHAGGRLACNRTPYLTHCCNTLCPPATRRFVLAMESGFLYYFKSPEQMSTPGISPKVVAISPEAAAAGGWSGSGRGNAYVSCPDAAACA